MTLSSNATTIVLYVTYAGLLISAVCGAVRLLRGESLADRVIALDVVLIALISGVAVNAAVAESSLGLDLLVVVAVIGFTTAVAATRFIEFDASQRPGKGASADLRSRPDSKDTTS